VTQAGNAYAMVVTGLALLGETPPAIESLADVAALFAQPTDVDVVGRRQEGRRVHRPPREPCRTRPPRVAVVVPGDRPVLASATIDDLVAQATAYAPATGIEYPWVREVLTDKASSVVRRPPSGRLWELGWTEGDGPSPSRARTP
jgi:hypothetical protein